MLRQQEDPTEAINNAAEDALDYLMPEVSVELLEETDKTILLSDPVSYATHL